LARDIDTSGGRRLHAYSGRPPRRCAPLQRHTTPAGFVGYVHSTAPGNHGIEARVRLIVPGPENSDSSLFSVLTSVDGHFRWTAIAEGRYVLKVQALGHTTLRIPLLVGSMGQDSIDILMRPDPWRLYDICSENCRPVPSADLIGRVACRAPKRSIPVGLSVEARIVEWGGPYLAPTQVNAHGRFTLKSLPFDDWVLVLQDATHDLAAQRVHHQAADTRPPVFVVPCT
jgi:hypothetical protein